MTKLLNTTLAMTLLTQLVAPLAAQTGDTRAGYLELFHSTGRVPARLTGTLPPIPGKTMSVLLGAPGHAFGAAFLSWRADLGPTTVTFGRDQLSIYADPLTLVTTIPVGMPSGFATISLPLPPDPSLVGLDLAWQGLTMSATLGSVSATNLLLANIGSTEGGNMVFANVVRRSWSLGCNECIDLDEFRSDKDKERIVKISGTRGRDDQELEVRVTDPKTNKTTTTKIGTGSTSWDLGTSGVRVPPGAKVEIRNPCRPRNERVSVTILTIDVTVL